MASENKENKLIPAEEVIKELESSKPWKWYRWLWWFLRYGIKNKIDELRWQIPNAIQRARRGWGHADVWGFDGYLAKVIAEGLKHLKKTQHILPTWDTGKESEEVAQKRWNEYLDKMIWTFEVATKIMDNYPENDWFYIPTKEWNDKEWIDMRKSFKNSKCLLKVMTKEECLAYEEGWNLFRIHFFSLWD